VIARRAKLDQLGQRMSSLKGSCDKIRKHRDAMDKQASENWSGWALLLGEKRKQRRLELASHLGFIYADDLRILNLITQEMDAARAALREVSTALGGPAGASPKNVPKAAKVLGEYAVAFEALRRQCSDVAEELTQLIDRLT